MKQEEGEVQCQVFFPIEIKALQQVGPDVDIECNRSEIGNRCLGSILHFSSEQYFEMKCCLAASPTTMQAVLQSMHGFSNWMKDKLQVFS